MIWKKIFHESYNEGNDNKEDNDDEGWFDIQEELTEEERKELDKSLQPVQLVLVKVSQVQ